MTERDLIELFNERIAIMTIDGEQKERDAVKHAYFMVRSIVGRDRIPELILDAMAGAMKS